MELILWRHAEAEPGSLELADEHRALTPKGQRHAARMGAWLERKLPAECRILVSPATRCVQTADALGRRYKVAEALSTASSAEAIIEACGWPTHRQPVLVVGHQPLLGDVASLLLCGQKQDWRIRKGGVFWIEHKASDGMPYIRLVAGPDGIGKLR